ncbi:MAG: aminotransferase class V-fold PLP-dependent enzyme [Gemmatimonadota bacterium]|nr:aminotransferase class V-fold PLP-dependent enzyme [Gemmatimonadota bacterium]
MNHLLESAAVRAGRYLDSLENRRVAPSHEAIERLRQLDGPLPKAPQPPEQILAQLDEFGSPATTANAGGRYFGFVTGGTLPAALAANWMAAAWDQNAFSILTSPVAVTLENIALRWVLEALELPENCGGAFVTGATMANFTALAAARHRVLAQSGWDVETDGLFGAPPIMVIVGEEVHPTLLKSLGLLGLGRHRVVRAPVDGQGRIRTETFPRISGPTIVCLQAGNVNTGAFDPAAELCARAHDGGAWVHVDGAFGIWAAAVPDRAHLTAGVAEADSWATDGHKWLNVPYDCGIAMVRHSDALRAAMSVTAAYLPDEATREPMHYTPEASRRARGIEVWAALRSLGRSGLSDLVDSNCRLATRFADGLQKAGYNILNDVVLNQVLVSFGDARTTRHTIRRIQDDGACWCGETVWQGQSAMRISVSSWKTTEADVDHSLDSMIRIAREEM